MRKRAVLLLLCFTLVVSVIAQNGQFKRVWYDGNAEIATYALKESRYGEIRNGTRVMVFVTEPLRIATHIKPDRQLPEEEKIRVIKLNDIRKFTTGIYDYSVMTSVFTAVEKKQGFENMATMKLSFSSQEWCGQVFDRIIRLPTRYEGVLYSYFESEGERTYSFDAKAVETEDNLWVRIRELNGSWLEGGESRKITVLPSRWITRKRHTPTATAETIITKGNEEKRPTVLGTIAVVPFSWTIETTTTIVFVEKNYPHRIVAFKERDGSSGVLLAVKRTPYWKQNGNRDLPMRQELKLVR